MLARDFLPSGWHNQTERVSNRPSGKHLHGLIQRSWSNLPSKEGKTEQNVPLGIAVDPYPTTYVFHSSSNQWSINLMHCIELYIILKSLRGSKSNATRPPKGIIDQSYTCFSLLRCWIHLPPILHSSIPPFPPNALASRVLQPTSSTKLFRE